MWWPSASAGGLEALKVIVGGLPSDTNAAVLVVLHTAGSVESRVPRFLARGPRPAFVEEA
jgi:two-component system, chemotaxis family, protein-glutamate methylesterase/glutaminase